MLGPGSPGSVLLCYLAWLQDQIEFAQRHVEQTYRKLNSTPHRPIETTSPRAIRLTPPSKPYWRPKTHPPIISPPESAQSLILPHTSADSFPAVTPSPYPPLVCTATSLSAEPSPLKVNVSTTTLGATHIDTSNNHLQSIDKGSFNLNSTPINHPPPKGIPTPPGEPPNDPPLSPLLESPAEAPPAPSPAPTRPIPLPVHHQMALPYSQAKPLQTPSIPSHSKPLSDSLSASQSQSMYPALQHSFQIISHIIKNASSPQICPQPNPVNEGVNPTICSCIKSVSHQISAHFKNNIKRPSSLEAELLLQAKFSCYYGCIKLAVSHLTWTKTKPYASLLDEIDDWLKETFDCTYLIYEELSRGLIIYWHGKKWEEDGPEKAQRINIKLKSKQILIELKPIPIDYQELEDSEHSEFH